MSAYRVQILGTSCVKPLHATKRFHLFLPFADSCFKLMFYIRDLLFYSLAAADASAFNLEALKHGLSLALVHFYPVAGRLHDDHETGQLTIDCNDDGIEFVEAVTDCTFAELEEKSFPIHDFYNDLVKFCYTEEHPLESAPLLSIQVTRFQGGIAIGVAASHVVFDGYSLWYFLKSWGQCCRGQAVSLPPLHARALMSSEFWGADKLSKIGLLKNDRLFPRPPPPPCAKAYRKVMHFDSTTAQQLKRTAIEESGNARISTFQVVMACVWKRITAADQDLPPHHKMRLHIPGDVRRRLMPSLTDAYFGNAVVITSISTTAGDLRRESLGATAAKINESLKVLEDEVYLRERMAAREEELSIALDEICRDGGKNLLVTRGLRFPVYDVDVGTGKPVAVRPAPMHNVDLIGVYSGREHGSIDVFVCFLSLQTLQAFLSITSPCIDI